MWGYGGYPQQYGAGIPGARPQAGYGQAYPQQYGAQPGYVQPSPAAAAFQGQPKSPLASPSARSVAVQLPGGSGGSGGNGNGNGNGSGNGNGNGGHHHQQAQTGPAPGKSNHPSTRNPLPAQPGTTIKLGVAFPAPSPVEQGDQGRIIGGKWRVIKVIGEGAFGKVRLASNVENEEEEVAIKTYNLAKLQPVEKERIQREITALRILKHPNIIRLVDVIEERSQRIFIVLALAPGGDLLDYVNEKGVLAESEARMFFKKVTNALEHCHDNQIVHRDLKLENVLLSGDDKDCFLTDFGLSNSLVGHNNEMLKTVCGTPIYRPPEMLKDQAYSPAVDVWALGVMLYAMLHGSFPFYETSLPQLFQRILAGRYPTPTEGSANAHDLIRRLLEPDPKKRITIPEVRRHAFWTADDVDVSEPPPERRVSMLFRVSDDPRRASLRRPGGPAGDRVNEAGSRISIRRHTLGRKSMAAKTEAQRAVIEARAEAGSKRAAANGSSASNTNNNNNNNNNNGNDAHEGEHPAISVD